MSERVVVPLMLGTAGHVDHGKTSLVRRLTSWDTDTHKEERERGMSIDFGVAPFAIDETRVTGIIDCPGHIDFIRNMVAGASAIDLLMLVVAADDGVMPQTREHLQIANLLGVKKIIVVLTKCDAVDAETKELATEDIRLLFENLQMEQAPVYEVSNQTGEGIAELRDGLVAAIEHIPIDHDERGFRMWVRKAFTMKGFGTVVTGIPLSGVLRSGESVVVLPSEEEISIRGMQNYRSAVEEIRGHMSCALNLRDISPDVFSRGMALVEPGRFKARRYFLVAFKNQTDRAIQRGKSPLTLRLHIGTAAVPVRVSGEVAAHSEGFLLLQSAKPIAAAIGDRVVVRTLSTSQTLGGGQIVLAADECSSRVLRNEYLSNAQETLGSGDALGTFYWSNPRAVFTSQQAVYAMQLPLALVESELRSRARSGVLIELGDQHWLLAARIEELAHELDDVLRHYHRGSPESLGMRDARVCEVLRIPRSSFAVTWQELQKGGRFRYEQGYVAVASFQSTITKQEREFREKLFALLAKPDTLILAKGTIQQELNIPEKDYKKVIKRLIDSGLIVGIGNGVMGMETVVAIEQQILRLFQTTAILELKEFRDATGLSRNAAVEVLEYFDSKGLTKRSGAGRVLNQRSS